LIPTLSTTPSLFRRLACWVYEGMLIFGVIFLAGYLFGTLSQTRNAMDNRPPLQLFIFVVLGIYFVWFWAKGQTLAMKTWHIRVVGVDGLPISQKRALLRYLLSWMWFMPPLAASWLLGLSGLLGGLLTLAWIAVWAGLSRLHPQRQFWHDAWAGTRLITSAPVKKTKPVSQTAASQNPPSP
jgi:uncharacterized RDD family membrane protein YckC